MIELILSEGIDVGKSNNSKQCIVCLCWCFHHRLQFRISVCNNSHDLKMLHLNSSNIDIITVKTVHYCCIIHDISKSGIIYLLEQFMVEGHGYI